MPKTLLLSIFTVAFCFLPACNGCDTTTAPDGGTTSTDPDGGVGPTGNGLNVTSAAVRSCQVLFTTNGNEVPSVSFDEAVKGEFIPKAPRFSLA
ncbi:MAG: hypothetical protein GY822_29620, partial [Deltaproteobacteria bacterium]|nr:hypothetical protein [Deltaproteobacteria bacterium]